MHYLYIIYSDSTDNYFIGESNDVPERVKLHNSHKNLKVFTRAAHDWELKLVFPCNSKKEAILLEKSLKEKKSRKFIERVIQNPKLLQGLLKDPQ